MNTTKGGMLLMRVVVAGLSLAGLHSVAAQTERRPLIPRAVLFGYAEHTAPALSPDGRQIAYLRTVNGTLELWVQTLGTSDDHPVTSASDGGKGNISNYFWHADGKQIFYQRDPLGNQTTRLYVLDTTTGKVRDLTQYEWTSVNVIGYSPKHPDTVLLMMNRRGPDHFDVYRVNAKTGETVLDTEAPADWMWGGWLVSPDLVVRGYLATLPDGSTVLHVRDGAKSPWRELMRFKPDDESGAYGWRDDNRTLVMMLASPDSENGAEKGPEKRQIVEVDTVTGARKPLMTLRTDVDLSGVWSSPVTKKVDLLQYDADKYEYAFPDGSLKKDFRVLERAHNVEIGGVDRGQDDMRWVVTYLTNAETWWYLYDRKTKHATPIYADQPALERYRVATKEPIHFRARDGLMLHGYVTRPVDAKSGERLPMVVLVHGGPEHRDEWSYDPWAMWLADRGYAVLQVNFRGSYGHGTKFLMAGFHQWAGTMRTDLLDGKAWAVKHGIADPKRVCIMGGSYGGYAVLAGLTFSPDEYACGVALAAPSDLVELHRSKANDNDFARELGHDEAELKAWSPMNYADRVKVPVLIVQGGSDTNVRQKQGDEMVAALRAHGKAVEYYVFPDMEHHSLGNASNSEAINAAIEAFLGKMLGGRVEPPTAVESRVLAGAKK